MLAKYVVRWWLRTFFCSVTPEWFANVIRQYSSAGAPAQMAVARSAIPESQSEAGTFFTPEQQAFARQLMGQQSKLFDLISGRLGAGTGGDITTGGGGDFASYFGNVSGGMGDVNFTDVPTSDVFTPQMLEQQANNLFATEQSRAGLPNLALFSARPGMAPVGERVGQNAALLEAGTRAGIAREYMNRIPNLMLQNAQQRLAAQAAQTNVENSRLNQRLQQAALASATRGQDIQGQLGAGRMAVDREGNLLRTLSGFGGGGGFLTPLSYSTSSSGPSKSQPAIYG